MSEHSLSELKPRNGVLALIAIFKLIKAAALIIVALAAWHLLSPDATEHLAERLTQLPFVTGHVLATRFAAWLLQLTPHSLEAIGAGAMGYAVVFIVEGIGLWRGKHWAEYLTTFVTASLIPFELYELFVKFGAVKLAALAVNLAIVFYLIKVLRRERPGEPTSASARAVSP